MSTAKFQSSLLDLVSDSEDDLSGLGVISSSQRPGSSAMPPKNGKGRPGTSKVTKPAPKTSASTRRANQRVAVAVEKETARKALIEKSNNPKPLEVPKGRRTRGAKDVEMEDAPTLASPPASDEAAKPKARGRPRKESQEQNDKEIPDSTSKTAPATRRPGRKTSRVASAPLEQIEEPSETIEEVTEIPETQPNNDMDSMEIDHTEQIELEDVSAPEPEPRRRALGSQSPRKLAGQDASEGGEPALRRRLGEMSRKFESLEQKYRDLREVAVKDAERNFDKLKKQGEEKANASKELVAALKKELAAQKELAREGQQLKKQLGASEAKAESLQLKFSEAAASLSEAKSESKSLTMKLAASRSAEAAAVAKAVPGSAMKGNLMRTAGNQEMIQQATRLAQLKEDLYSDLTGLIVRGIKHEGDEEVYDCLQTGRDGRTLHFKLSICNDLSSDAYEEAQFTYRPLLDESRDRELISILPDYLVEEITFPRPQAAKFYGKVLEALTTRM